MELLWGEGYNWRFYPLKEKYPHKRNMEGGANEATLLTGSSPIITSEPWKVDVVWEELQHHANKGVRGFLSRKSCATFH